MSFCQIGNFTSMHDSYKVVVLFDRYEKATQNKIKWAMKAYVRWMNCRNYQVQHGLISKERLVPTPDQLIDMEKSEFVRSCVHLSWRLRTVKVTITTGTLCMI